MGQIEAVETILSDLGVSNIPIINIFNKIDLLPNKEDFLEKNTNSNGETIYISAKTGEGTQSFKENLKSVLFKKLKLFYLQIPREKKEMIDSFSRWSIILKKRENGDFFELKIMADPESMINYLPYIKRGEKNW